MGHKATTISLHVGLSLARTCAWPQVMSGMASSASIVLLQVVFGGLRFFFQGGVHLRVRPYPLLNNEVDWEEGILLNQLFLLRLNGNYLAIIVLILWAHCS